MVLTVEELRKLIDKSRTKQRERLMGCIIYYTPSLVHCVFSHSEARGVTIYSHRRGAFSVARFDLSGNAKAFLSWNEQQNWLHAFLMYISKVNNDQQDWLHVLYLYKSTTTLLINAFNGALVQRLNKHEKKSERKMAAIAVFSNGSVWSNCM